MFFSEVLKVSLNEVKDSLSISIKMPGLIVDEETGEEIKLKGALIRKIPK